MQTRPFLSQLYGSMCHLLPLVFGVKDVHVFALERESDGGGMGRRFYLVTSYTELWHYYR